VALVWTRVDQKLIHGQISVAWVPYLSINAIVVADDDLVDDTWAQKVMMMGLPPEIKLTGFTAPDRLSSVLAEDEYQDLRVMVIFKDVAGALEAAEAGFKMEILNLGNQASQDPAIEVRLGDTFYVKPDDLEKLGCLQRSGLEVILQAIPAGKVVQWKPGVK